MNDINKIFKLNQSFYSELYDCDYNTKLHYVIENNDPNLLQQYMNERSIKKEIYHSNNEGIRPIDIAIKNKNKKIIKLLRNYKGNRTRRYL